MPETVNMNTKKALLKSVELLSKGEAVEALQLTSEVLKKHPQLAVAHLVKGRCLLMVSRVDEAVAALRQALQNDPNSTEALVSLAMALQQQGKMEEPLTLFIRAMELDPNSTTIMCKAANFMLNRGFLDDAEILYRQAANKGDSGALNGLLMILERRGDTEAALSLIEQNKHALSTSVALTQTYAKLLYREKNYTQALTALDAIDESQLPPSVGVTYYQLLGDINHELAAADKAFDAYQQSNQLRNIHYDWQAHEQRISEIISKYPEASSFSSLPCAESCSDLPIFIVGMPRTGTSLLEQILSMHSAMHCAGELDYINDIALNLAPDSQEYISAAADKYLSALKLLDPEARHITDKMPHNYLHLGLIAQLFPAAKIIICRRDALDTGLSCYRRNFHATHDYATDLWSIGHYMGQLERLVEHWKTVLPLPILEVNYEALVGDFEANVREVLDFCGLPWEETVLSFHQADRLVTTASYHQVKQPLYGSSVGYAKSYAKHLQMLQEGLQVWQKRTPA
ncbi:MAG: sulfotransferase [SAR86 cluster bacterium]|uniref:Sulfotransferase n=1 Tax=SAR86 cluster bacterium TaxID=2030880 RepID=A0A973AAH6_9GAMM|nr:sulfotransferase [SAR86 cluster bacterium]|tara:strand:- start:94 stop:1635 length:1542 start_codon:yes stop_codon:yes gene_type:complete